jgi:ferritin-like metal-binding protein YciE
MNLTTLEKLFVHELKDLYSAENQLLEALPKMANAASNDSLRTAFEDHRKETQEHVRRLEQVFEDLDFKPGGEHCDGMEGLLEEGEEIIEMDGNPSVKDAALIAAAQRVEHYEIAGYGTARNIARHLGNQKAEKLLQTTLDEEGKADKLLTELAEHGSHINEMALR